MAQDTLQPNLLFKLDDKPPVVGSALVGFQHLVAIIGGILTAPYLIALGMGLDPQDTAYVISAALIVSGLGTLLQINRLGAMGTGLLSVQGTSFAFIGSLIFAHLQLAERMTAQEALGVIFGSSAVCAVLMGVLSLFVRQLKNIITTNVAGATIILIGLSLIQATLQNLERVYLDFGGLEGEGAVRMGLAGAVFLVIVVLANIKLVWLRLSAIAIGLLVGVVMSMTLSFADFSGVTSAGWVFIPEPWRYPLSVDFAVVALIMPIFLVSAMESIGDVTATNNLSGLETGTFEYWMRIRGGIMATSVTSVVAAVLCTFPSTTFSQNNGVIRLTGVCSRYVGNYIAIFLVILGCMPVVTAFFQAIPSEVIFGATLLMFILVGLSGFRVVEMSGPSVRDWVVVTFAILFGYLCANFVDRVPGLSDEVVMVLQFPVSTGAMLAIILEFVIPGRAAGTSD
ncbi:MAG: hypothetical protein JJ921_04685 [Pseudomonadales bacterium]|nr:hypothetical protein [Pseudomonadales bacterium]MBO6564280.1 hypothetical protein [Pseudomonadales bacterium]MBO6595107.1 hypothetical protein [Pseudomonadales bacterium]MBO6701612.1 hypothetical protein [Pseudomonadales bacterium]MBO6821334.1 hypothetical protein [Pseudomonadales bacterium]